MMDLAEIRKKARGPQKRIVSETTEREVACAAPPIVQGVPEAIVSEVAYRTSNASRSAVDSADLLDALFAERSEIDAFFSAQEFKEHTSIEESIETIPRQLLCFSLENEEYAIDISDIREIVKPREITDIPRVPQFVLGIISLRGIIIPIYDLKRRLQLGESLIGSDSRIIVCQQKDRVVGLLVDKISQVVRISGEAIEPPPAILSGVDRAFVEGVGRNQDRMVILLCLSNVLDAELV